jgi:NAD-dependent DNA ligase
MIEDPATQILMRKRQLNKSMEMLLGLVTGIIADGHLHDLEIKLLHSWLADHGEVTAVWPGSVVAQLLNTILADGVITEAEREHLLKNLRQLAVTDFAHTGSISPEVITLPVDEHCPVALRDANICLTGEFLFGTRAKCEEIAARAGATPHGTVTRKIAYLVIGTNVSPHWAHTSYGRKIEQAMELQRAGHPIRIISERRWLAALA